MTDELKQKFAFDEAAAGGFVGADGPSQLNPKYKHNPFCDCGVCNFCDGTEDMFGNRRHKHCSACGSFFDRGRDDCPACYYRKMAGTYGARMQYFRDALVTIANFPNANYEDAADAIEQFAQNRLAAYNRFNLQELFADCFLILTETSRLFSLIVAHEIEFPPYLNDEIRAFVEIEKTMVEKYREANEEPHERGRQ